jgi:hypothetical protein
VYRDAPCENHTSSDTLTLQLGNYMSDILGNNASGNLKLEFH